MSAEEITDDVVKPGDLREGTGTHKVRVRVVSVDETDAECQLIRMTGRVKTISLRQLRTAYRLIERGEPPTEGQP